MAATEMTAGTPDVKKGRGMSARRRGDLAFAWALILPALLMLSVFMIYPILYSFNMSFRRWYLATTSGNGVWVGLDNYVSMLTDEYFQQSIVHTFTFVLASVALACVVGMLLALALNREFIGRGFFRGAVLLPWMMPGVIVGVIWMWIFNGDYGALNAILLQVFGVTEKIYWFTRADWAMGALIAVEVWRSVPFVMLVLLAGLQTINREYYEAAAIDGASAFQAFRFITMPLLRYMIMVVLIIRTMDALRVFDLVWVLTGGGPSRGTEVMFTYIYQRGFVYFDFAQASAGSFVALFLIMLITVLYITIFERRAREDA